MQPHDGATRTDLTLMNALGDLFLSPPVLPALPECLDTFCRSLAKDLPDLEARALAGQVQDQLRPGQDLDRACPQFLSQLIQDPLWGLAGATRNGGLRQLAEGLNSYLRDQSGTLSQVLPTLMAEAGEELRASKHQPRDLRVLRALKLIWSASLRGPRCQALAAQACRRVWGRQSGVAQAQRAFLLSHLQDLPKRSA